jgi:hypothetical protein
MTGPFSCRRLRGLLVALLIACGALDAASARESRVVFAPDRHAQATAAREAAEFVRFAAAALGTRLDFSEDSVHAVEELAGELHADLRRQRGAAVEIAPLVTMIGSYLGEVLRRRHGGEWGWLTVNGRQVLGFRAARSGALFAPVETAKRRVHEGASGTLWRAYQVNARR